VMADPAPVDEPEGEKVYEVIPKVRWMEDR
jgi:hypothetical protein